MDALARLPSRPVGRAGRPPARRVGSAGGRRRGAAMNRFARRLRPLWIAALIHRLSGLALAIFLPLHFLALGLAISGADALEHFLRWADQPAVKLSEGILVALENLAWREGQARRALLAIAGAMVIAFLFLAVTLSP